MLETHAPKPHSTQYVRSSAVGALLQYYASLTAQRGWVALRTHRLISVAERRRTRRTKPSTTLPQSAPHHVRKTGLVRAFGHGGGRGGESVSSRSHAPCHGALDASRDPWPVWTHGVPASSPRYGHDLHVASMARPLSRYAEEIGSPFSTLAQSHHLQDANDRLCACARVRVCVRACVCARRRWRGRGATMPQVAGRQALPALSLRRRAFEILLGLIL